MFYAYVFVPILGTFLVNSLPALVLFDSGASMSFVSQSFSKEFSVSVGDLECPLCVSDEYEHGVFASTKGVSWRFSECPFQ